MIETVRVDVPARFFDDHRSRDCSPSAVVVKRLSRTVRVDLDRAAFDDLLSDAEHYASGAMDEWLRDPDAFVQASATIRSARATVDRLRAVEARRLTEVWESARQRKESSISDAADRAEQEAWDALVDYVEANELNGTDLDPRGDL